MSSVSDNAKCVKSSRRGSTAFVNEVKAAVRGRWIEILAAVGGFDPSILDGAKEHPCPKCGGKTRFRLIDKEDGAVFCSQCFSKDNGDGWAALQWKMGWEFLPAVGKVAEYLRIEPPAGLNMWRPSKTSTLENVLATVAKMKNVTPESLVVYGAKAKKNDRGKASVYFPVYDGDGKQISEFYITPGGGEKAEKGLFVKGGKHGVFLPHDADGNAILPKFGEKWLIVEGLKDAAALHNLGYLAVGMPTNNLAASFCRLLIGVNVILVPDSDKPGINGMNETASRLAGPAKSVAIATLPVEVTESHGKDCRDVLAQHDGEKLLREAIEKAVPWDASRDPSPDPNGRVEIKVTPKEHEVADEAIAALAKLDGLYQRGGSLVEIVRDLEPPTGIVRQPGGMYSSAISEAGLWDKLSQSARFYKELETSEGVIKQDLVPPKRIARIILARQRRPNIPQLEGIVQAPAFLADGTILATPGYCKRSGLWLDSRESFPAVPESPTLADAQQARDELLEVAIDFPFANEANRAAWLALALTPAARHAIDGCIPLGAIDANVAGSGKSKAADCVGMIHLGRDLPRTTAPTTDEEFRKRITATLLAGDQMMLLDNISGPLGCQSLDAVLTGTVWSDRILGQSKMSGSLPANTIWLASGNNIVFEGDTVRRTLYIRLESREENPEERHGFRHPHLLPWVRQHRARLAVAAVTILRAYHVAGRPNMKLPEWGSFESWSNLIRNAIVWLGMSDPGKTRQQVREQSDNSADLLRQFIAAWEVADPTRYGISVHQAIEKAMIIPQLQSIFAELGTAGKPPNSRSIGMKLSHMRGRVVGGKYLEKWNGAGHIAYWRIASTETQGTKGTKGTNPDTPYKQDLESNTHDESPGQREKAENGPLSPPSPPVEEEVLF